MIRLSCVVLYGGISLVSVIVLSLIYNPTIVLLSIPPAYIITPVIVTGIGFVGILVLILVNYNSNKTKDILMYIPIAIFPFVINTIFLVRSWIENPTLTFKF